MAIRNIRKDNDEILRKQCKNVMQINDSLRKLVNDMTDTMYDANGVGLAAPQIGVLKKIIIIDDGTGLIVLINPVIISTEGEQICNEGCLSVPGYTGSLKRPMKVVVNGFNENGEKIKVEGVDLMASILCHEIDHLNGVLFTDKALEIFEIEGRKSSRRSKN